MPDKLFGLSDAPRMTDYIVEANPRQGLRFPVSGENASIAISRSSANTVSVTKISQTNTQSSSIC